MKLFNRILWVALLCLTAWACSDDTIQPLKFTIDETAVTLNSGKGGTYDILIRSNASQITASVDAASQDWLKADVTPRCLTLTYTTNDSGTERIGSVHLNVDGEQELTVSLTLPPYFTTVDGQSFAVGDIYYEEGKPMGVIFWVDSADPTIAKAVSLDRTGGAWSTVGTNFVGAWSKVDGQANTDLIRASEEGKNGSIPALAFCDAHGDDWYWPAINELEELFTAWNGTSIEESSGTAGGNDTEKAARAAFDKHFTDNGGTALDLSTSGNGESYWASTEDNSDASYSRYGCNVRFRKGAVNMGAAQCKKTGTARYIRCVKAIGDYTAPAEPIEVSIALDAESVVLDSKQGSSQTVVATITNGTLTAATPADGSWLGVSVQGTNITVSTLSDNTSTESRTTTVTLAVAGDDGIAYSKSFAVSQKGIDKPQEPTDFVVGAYYESGSTKGVIFWVADDGASAKIVSLTRSETTLAWAVESKGYGTTDSNDGAVNTAMLQQAADGNVPALSYCVDGWYWPAINELRALFEAYNGTTFDAATVAAPSGISEAEKASRTAFDATLTEHGGTALNTASQSATGDQYWGSTELSDEYGSYLRFGKLYVGTLADTPVKTGASKRYIRVVKLIQK